MPKKVQKVAVKKTSQVKPAAAKKTVKKSPIKKTTKPVATKKTTKKTAKKKVTNKKTTKSIPSPYGNEVKKEKKLNVRSRFLMTPRSFITLIQFDSDEVAIQVARYGGAIALLVGTFLTMQMPLLTEYISPSFSQSALLLNWFSSESPLSIEYSRESLLVLFPLVVILLGILLLVFSKLLQFRKGKLTAV